MTLTDEQIKQKWIDMVKAEPGEITKHGSGYMVTKVARWAIRVDLWAAFSRFYDLLSQVGQEMDDTLWYCNGNTAHEALIDLAAEFSPELEAELQARLERDCGLVETA